MNSQKFQSPTVKFSHPQLAAKSPFTPKKNHYSNIQPYPREAKMRAPIKGFPNYVATMEGDIINVQSNKKLSGTTVSLRRGKETHPKRKDRIIANAYLGPSKRRIIHIDGNPENCAVSNLAYHSKAGAVAIFEDGVALYGRNLDRNYLSDRGAHTLHPLEFAAPHAIKAAFPQIKRLIKC